MERRRKIEGTTRIGGINLQVARTATSDAMTTSVAEEVGNASSVGDNRTRSNGESGKDKCSNDMLSTEGRGCSKKPLYYGHR